MTVYAVLENNVVVNRIVAESKEIAEQATERSCVEDDGTADIGDTWDGTSFVSPDIE